jgi:hypothetical protein
MYDDFRGSVEGDMTVPNQRKSHNQGSEPEFNTLDEPIRDTVVSVILFIKRFVNERKENFYA